MVLGLRTYLKLAGLEGHPTNAKLATNVSITQRHLRKPTSTLGSSVAHLDLSPKTQYSWPMELTQEQIDEFIYINKKIPGFEKYTDDQVKENANGVANYYLTLFKIYRRLEKEGVCLD
jgi:hypothetical protein